MTVRPGVRACVLALALACGACASLSPAQRERAGQLVAAARAATTVTCTKPDRCARPSPLHALAARAFAESTPDAPRHYALILDRGHDALLARIDLLRHCRPQPGTLSIRDVHRREVFTIEPAACDAPARGCDVIGTGSIHRGDYGLGRWSLAFADKVRFLLRVRVRGDAGA